GFGGYSRMPRGVSTGWPRIRSTTRRAFWAVIREKRLVARASMPTCPLLPLRSRGGRGRRGGTGGLDLALSVAGVPVEGAGRRELAELVAGGGLGDQHRDGTAPGLPGQGGAAHLGRDRRPARPGLHHTLLAGLDHRPHPLHQVEVDEGTFLDRACHARDSLFPYFTLRRWRMNFSVRLLWRVL